MAGGRPTLYSEDMLSKTKEYIESCKDIDITNQDGNSTGRVKVKIPTIEGLAVFLDVNKTTIYEWESNQEEFSNVIDKLRSIQASRLLENGLAGAYNSTITKLMLVKHGYRDAVDTDVTTKGEKININDPKVLELAKKYEEELKKGL